MKPMYRLLAIDVDGTLMDSRNQLPEANRQALHRAHQAGLAVCLCTGRSLIETREVIDRLGLDSDAGVFVFGAVVSALPGGRTLQRTPIPPPLADRLIEHFQAGGHCVLILYDGTEAGVDYHLLAGRRNRDACEQWLSRSPARCQWIERWPAGPHPPVRIGIIEQPADIDATLAALAAAFPPSALKFNPIFAPNYGVHVVECFAPQVNKWYGVSQVAERLGIDRREIVAIGDDINDLEMIVQAGLGIAMGNAIPRVKAAARWHAPPHDQAGLAAAVDALLDGNLNGESTQRGA